MFTADGFSMLNGEGKKVAEGTLRGHHFLETYLGTASNLTGLYLFGMMSTLAVFNDGTAEVIWKGSGIPVLSVSFGTLQ